jgi:hypothetical protein
MSLSESEYTVLRHTIASRGTVRITLLPVTLIGWSIVAGTLTVLGNNPAMSLFSLAVLAGGFEAIHAMHVGVERIGRYLQVFYEGSADVPRWETTAMSLGPALPGGGVDPLFTLVFAFSTVLNLLSASIPSPTRLELSVIGLMHGAFLVRLVRARWAASRQRAIDLESYRAVKMRLPNGKE